MKPSRVLRAALLSACVVLLAAAVACGLHLVEEAENDITGWDRPPSSVRIDRTGERSYDVYLLGTGYHVDLAAELAGARRAALVAVSVARKGVWHAADCVRRAMCSLRCRGGQGG